MDPEIVVQRGEVTQQGTENQVGFLTVAGFIGACSLQSEPGLYRGRKGARDPTILP